jgi:hypothetical protein
MQIREMTYSFQLLTGLNSGGGTLVIMLFMLEISKLVVKINPMLST